MRKKPNLIPRMERVSQLLVSQPGELRGKWLHSFGDFRQVHLEIGCGKGRFTVQCAQENPDVLLIGLEKVPEAIVVAMERVRDRGLKNALFLDKDALLLEEYFAPAEVSRIYLNFSDPWPKSRSAKHRLTAPGFLDIYSKILPPGGEIHFKTDNLPLFEFSLESFGEMGFPVSELTYDLHENGVQGILTDYEAKFIEQGQKINSCIATRPTLD